MRKEVQICEKSDLTLKEAVEYSRIMRTVLSDSF